MILTDTALPDERGERQQRKSNVLNFMENQTTRIAKIALQCIHPISGDTGTFLYKNGSSHRDPEAALSECFTDLAELHAWAIADGWRSERATYVKTLKDS